MCRAVKRCAALCFALLSVLSFTAAAETVKLNVGSEFIVYGDNGDKLAEILGMSAEELEAYTAKNGIVYLAANEENTKQIRLTQSTTAFSESVCELSSLNETEIGAVAADLAGDDFKTELVFSNGKSFVKATAALKDSGGEYTLIRYITVTDKKEYVLSFYTAASESTDYTEEIFESLSFGAKKTTERSGVFVYLLSAAAALVLIFAGCILYTVIRDLRKREKSEKSES